MSLKEYSDKVLAHFDSPRNVGSFGDEVRGVGTALVGSSARGDVLKLQIKVSLRGVIEEARFRAYGSPGTIAAGSWVTAWLSGKTLTQAWELQVSQIVAALELPPIKIRCAVLAEEAVRAALADHEARWRKVDAS